MGTESLKKNLATETIRHFNLNAIGLLWVVIDGNALWFFRRPEFDILFHSALFTLNTAAENFKFTRRKQ